MCSKKKKKMIYMNLKNRKRFTDLEEELMVARGEGIVREFGMDMCTLLYLKWITTRTYCGTLINTVSACMGEEFEGEWIHVYVWPSSFIVHLKLSQHCSLAIPRFKIKIKKRRICFPVQGTWVHSLVGKLRPQMLWSN